MVPERSEVLMSQYDVVVNDGAWHRLHLLITRDEMRLRLDNTTSVQPLQQHIRTGPPQYYNNPVFPNPDKSLMAN